MKINNYLSVVLLGGLAVLLVGCSTIDKNTTSDIEDGMEISMNHSDIPIPFTDAENRELDLREQFRKSADYVVEDDFHGEVYINITDTEDCHSYKNEEYGFALTFPSRAEGNTCKVLQKTYFGKEGAFFVSFAFLLPDDPKKGNGLMSNPVGLYNTPLFVVDPDDERYNTGPIPAYGRYGSFRLLIMDEAGYNDPSWEYDIYNREWLEQFKKTNNKYYFVIWHDPEYAYFKLGYGSGGEGMEAGSVYTENHIDIFDVE